MPDAPAPILEARQLSLSRDEEPIFGPLDFAALPGQVLVIEGGNGAGKTSLLRVLCGSLEPSGGELLFQGENFTSREWLPGTLALLGHALGLKAELTPVENLRLRIVMEGQRPGTSIVGTLSSVGLAGFEDTPLHQLSAGQKKRTALAGLLLSASVLWLLDEPYANLDRGGRTLVDRMLDTHTARGGAVILTSHGLIQPAAARVVTVGIDRNGATP